MKGGEEACRYSLMVFLRAMALEDSTCSRIL